MKKIIFIIFLILVIIILFNILIQNTQQQSQQQSQQKINENFGDFSPYIGNRNYPFVFLKNRDDQLLQQKLKRWETPFNLHNEGYINAEPCGTPPLVPLYSYVEMKEVRFRDT
jgi:hypothetical protein